MILLRANLHSFLRVTQILVSTTISTFISARSLPHGSLSHFIVYSSFVGCGHIICFMADQHGLIVPSADPMNPSSVCGCCYICGPVRLMAAGSISGSPARFIGEQLKSAQVAPPLLSERLKRPTFDCTFSASGKDKSTTILLNGTDSLRIKGRSRGEFYYPEKEVSNI